VLGAFARVISVDPANPTAENDLARFGAHGRSITAALETAAMPLPIDARNGWTAPPLGRARKNDIGPQGGKRMETRL
jgi:hypothetical protein